MMDRVPAPTASSRIRGYAARTAPAILRKTPMPDPVRLACRTRSRAGRGGSRRRSVTSSAWIGAASASIAAPTRRPWAVTLASQRLRARPPWPTHAAAGLATPTLPRKRMTWPKPYSARKANSFWSLKPRSARAVTERCRIGAMPDSTEMRGFVRGPPDTGIRRILCPGRGARRLPSGARLR
jgi:hypothetical protein